MWKQEKKKRWERSSGKERGNLNKCLSAGFKPGLIKSMVLLSCIHFQMEKNTDDLLPPRDSGHGSFSGTRISATTDFMNFFDKMMLGGAKSKNQRD